jgi:hypothetical protein
MAAASYITTMADGCLLVALTRGKSAIVDAVDLPVVQGFRWRAVFDGWHWYAVREEMHAGRQRQIRMHRSILGASAGSEVDHRDGDGLNNRRSNLRPATSAQNQHNRRKQCNNTSGFKGVDRRGDLWRARISAGNKRLELGLFATPELAHAAYADAAVKLHGEFARAT